MGKILVRIAAQSATTNRAQVSASYIKIRFTKLDLSNQKKKKLQLQENLPQPVYLVLHKPSCESEITLTLPTLKYHAHFTSSCRQHVQCSCSATSVFKKLICLQSISLFPSIVPFSFRQLMRPSTNYIIITHRSLTKRDWIIQTRFQCICKPIVPPLAGGSYDTLTVSIDQLYNQI